MKLIEQMVYDVGGNTMKESWKFVKAHSINNLYNISLLKNTHNSINLKKNNIKILIDEFFEKFFPNSFPNTDDVYDSFYLHLSDVKSKELKISTELHKFIVRFGVLNQNITAQYSHPRDYDGYNNGYIIINNLGAPFTNFLIPLFNFISKKDYNRAKNQVYYILKIIYSSFKHEMIHLIDFINEKSYMKYDSKNTNLVQYLNSESEFPTQLSSLYSFFKRVVAKKRKKISYKQFFYYLLKSKPEDFKHNKDTTPLILIILRNEGKLKFTKFSKRLFNLLKKDYLYNDGTPLPIFLK